MNAAASMKTSVDMVNEGLITKEDALTTAQPITIDAVNVQPN